MNEMEKKKLWDRDAIVRSHGLLSPLYPEEYMDYEIEVMFMDSGMSMISPILDEDGLEFRCQVMGEAMKNLTTFKRLKRTTQVCRDTIGFMMDSGDLMTNLLTETLPEEERVWNEESGKWIPKSPFVQLRIQFLNRPNILGMTCELLQVNKYAEVDPQYNHPMSMVYGAVLTPQEDLILAKKRAEAYIQARGWNKNELTQSHMFELNYIINPEWEHPMIQGNDMIPPLLEEEVTEDGFLVTNP